MSKLIDARDRFPQSFTMAASATLELPPDHRAMPEEFDAIADHYIDEAYRTAVGAEYDDAERARMFARLAARFQLESVK